MSFQEHCSKRKDKKFNRRLTSNHLAFQEQGPSTLHRK